MKLNHVVITNWKGPGVQWWDSVDAQPDKPLIEARIEMTLSAREYRELLERDRPGSAMPLPINSPNESVPPSAVPFRSPP